MERMIEFILNNVAVVVVAILGFSFPGVLTIFLFNRELFLQLDILKLMILAASISTPSLGGVLAAIVWKETTSEPLQVQIGIAFTINMIIFSFMLALKIVWRSMNSTYFAIGIILMCILSALVYQHIKTENEA